MTRTEILMLYTHIYEGISPEKNEVHEDIKKLLTELYRKYEMMFDYVEAIRIVKNELGKDEPVTELLAKVEDQLIEKLNS